MHPEDIASIFFVWIITEITNKKQCKTEGAWVDGMDWPCQNCVITRQIRSSRHSSPSGTNWKTNGVVAPVADPALLEIITVAYYTTIWVIRNDFQSSLYSVKIKKQSDHGINIFSKFFHSLAFLWTYLWS